MAYQEITPIHYPLQFVKGNDWVREITVVVNDEGGLMDFSGMSAIAQVRKNAKSSEVIAEFSTYAGTLELSTGKMKLNLPKEEVSTVEAQKYIWDCEFTDTEGNELTWILPSEFYLIENVTDN